MLKLQINGLIKKLLFSSSWDGCTGNSRFFNKIEKKMENEVEEKSVLLENLLESNSSNKIEKMMRQRYADIQSSANNL